MPSVIICYKKKTLKYIFIIVPLILPAIDHYSRDVEIVLVSIKVTAAETAA